MKAGYVRNIKRDPHVRLKLGSRPTVPCRSCLRSPNAIPARITILRFASLLVRNQGVPLLYQRVDLEHISIATVVSGVDNDLKVVIEFLSYITS